MKRGSENKLTVVEVGLVKAMLAEGVLNDRAILAYFTRPGRTVNHAAGRYAGMVMVPEADAADPGTDTVEPLLRLRDRALLPPMNAKEAMALFEAAEAEALVVLDGAETRKVVGLLTEAHLLRRCGEDLGKRRHEEAGSAPPS